MSVVVGEETIAVDHNFDAFAELSSADTIQPEKAPANCSATVPLIRLAYARSGDKGNHSNIGVIARKPEYLPFIQAALTEQAVAEYMQHTLDPNTGKVSGWNLSGFHAINFLLENSLGGGGVASLRIDPQGKAFGQQLLEFPIPVTEKIAKALAK